MASQSGSIRKVVIKGTGRRKAPPKVDSNRKPPGSTLTRNENKPSQKS